MVQFTALKRLTSAGVGATLPTTSNGAGARSVSHRRRVANSFINLRLTILCGVVTILVLRGTIGLNNFSSNNSPSLDQNQKLVEETNRVIAEIRYDDNDNDDDDNFEYPQNSTYSLDLLDSWAPMGPKGKIRDDAGKILSENLKVDRYEEMIQKYQPGFGDERWPFVTHFVGYNQVLKLYGFRHRGLSSPNVKRIRNETFRPLEFVSDLDIRHSTFFRGSL
ncbi:hypothetical protein KY289_022893 [Solanum tuberosum]|nr:hypothetical protein KY289_022893 [Solanum tuberosum]